MESVSLLGTLGAWVAAHPVLALLAAAALPFLATVVSELLPKAPALPPQEPTAEALPAASDAERSAAVLEPLPVPAIEPEPVAAAEPQPTTDAPAAPVFPLRRQAQITEERAPQRLSQRFSIRPIRSLDLEGDPGLRRPYARN